LALHTILVNPSGQVERSWAVVEPKCAPPWPEFREAIETALKHHEYEPATLDGKPVATCVQAVTHIDWR
jgi:hypothetical protein